MTPPYGSGLTYENRNEQDNELADLGLLLQQDLVVLTQRRAEDN